MNMNDIVIENMSNVGSFNELEEYIKDNWTWFVNNGHKANKWRMTERTYKIYKTKYSPKLIDISIINILFIRYIRERPAWTAELKFKIDIDDKLGWGSSYFNNTKIHTESGGLRKDGYSYYIHLLADDFPLIYEQHQKDEWIKNENNNRRSIWKTLGGADNVPLVTEVPENWRESV